VILKNDLLLLALQKLSTAKFLMATDSLGVFAGCRSAVAGRREAVDVIFMQNDHTVADCLQQRRDRCEAVHHRQDRRPLMSPRSGGNWMPPTGDVAASPTAWLEPVGARKYRE
jgi:hypothetical protein